MSLLPRIRVLHHLPRTGGTLICRCLAVMAGVFLLSEIHPDTDDQLDRLKPANQAAEWYDIDDDDDESLGGERDHGARHRSFLDIIEGINQKVIARGGVLVIRDWSHLDFTGFPHNLAPTGRSRTTEVLSERFEVIHAATVRKPLPQYFSHRALLVASAPQHAQMIDREFGPDRFLDAYNQFASFAHDIGFERYEDFVADSEAVLRRICARLDIPYDPGWRERWQNYDRLTGDVDGPTDGIRHIARVYPDDLKRLFATRPLSLVAARLLGYDESV